MEKKFFAKSGLPIRRTVELLPKVFQTSANTKFLEGVLDPLVQPGSLEKLSGYVGRKYGKTYNSSDVYIDDQETLRSKYQLEPSVVITDNNNSVSNFYDYVDLKNQLEFFGNINERDDLVFSDEHYSWAPPIEWDKFINYREYFWLPDGPPTVEIKGEQTFDTTTTYKVRTTDSFDWVFSPDGLKKNPAINLYRGQTYYFEVNSPGDPFYIRTSNIQGFTSNYNTGVTNNGTTNGTVKFEVPFDAPDLLYYQSDNELSRVGSFRIFNVDEATFINVEEKIIGAKEFTSANGVKFTNGLKVRFVGNVEPAMYRDTYWFVEGVGDFIKLVSFNDLELPVISTTNPDVPFDSNPFDTVPFDDATSYPTQKDYITINRKSIDNNSWSRYNRWFHRSVIDLANSLNNTVSDLSEDQRAKRPIIEFKGNLQLFNHGAVSKQSVDLIDTSCTDVFSLIEGKSGYFIDNVALFEGARVLFTADTDPLVKNKIYQVKFLSLQNSPELAVSATATIRNQITLIETNDTIPVVGESVYVKRGVLNKGKSYHFNGDTWLQSQLKSNVNQAPLFDCFDEQGVSFSDADKYSFSSFTGSKILSYAPATSGVIDSELGFKLSYVNINNVGDIKFNFDFDNDSFTWQNAREINSEDINSGFFRFNQSLTEFSYSNGWTKTSENFVQPIIQTINVAKETTTVDITACNWNESTREYFVVYVNGIFKKTGWTVSTPSNNNSLKKLVFDTKLMAGDVISIKVFTDATPDQGYYEIPMGLEKNPLNIDLSFFTLGQATDHLNSIFEIDQRLFGSFPGSNNLRDLTDFEKYGRRFVKHSGLLPVALTALCNKEMNIVKAIRNAKTEYTKFKNNLMQLAVELPYDFEPTEFLDQIVQAMSVGKTEVSPFFASDMIGFGAANIFTYTVEDEGIKVFALSEKFDLSTQSDKAVYVYLNDVQLIVNKDYTFDKTFGFVRLNVTLSENDVIKIKEYVSTAYNFIPPTPTKLGLYKKYIPEIIVDDSYLEPQTMIRGHDGSLTVSYGDFRDEVLLEFEKRIYNNLKLDYDVDLINIDQNFGGYYGNAKYSRKDLNAIVKEDFLYWISDTDIDSVNNIYFDDFNSFTYTYSSMTDPQDQVKLPGWWRGVYNWFYDTDTPHTTPWEMLGFAQKPSWWEEEYGPAPYTSGNLILWEDIRDGIIRQGDRKNLVGETRYKRPSILSHIPVDEFGNLFSPIDSRLAQNFSLVLANRPFVFGDSSPAETAWRKSSEWPFSVITALTLLSPADFISRSFNKLMIDRNIIGQLVHKTTRKFLTTTNFNFLDFNSSEEIFGLGTYVSALVRSQSLNSNIISQKLTSIDVRLAHKISGFVDKSQYRYLLDSRSPKATLSNIFVPSENINIIFNTGTPFVSVSYSGVIIEKRTDGWKVSGYNKLNPLFSYYEPIPTTVDYSISVGGITESFLSWESEKFYGKDSIVQLDNSYYRARESHTSGEKFDSTKWNKLSQLPVVGATTALIRGNFDKSEVKEVPYGTVYATNQEVVDFLIGYGEYLTDSGIIFDEYDASIQVAKNWTTSAKEFLFWTTHNWEVGSLLSLSPASTQLKIDIPLGTADNLLDSFYEYSVLTTDGTKLDRTNIDVSRTNEFVITPFNTEQGIYFARVNFVLKEHVAIFDNKTVFNDTIYDPAPGYRQERIKVVGFRSVDWEGNFTVPGFLFDDAKIENWEPFVDYKLGDIVKYKDFYFTSNEFQQGTASFDYNNWSKLDQLPTQGLITNYDYRINQFEDYYDLDAAGVQTSQRDLARHAIGYQSREYLQNIAQDEISQYKIYQGFIREKGTPNSITKIFDKLTRANQEGIILNEEWAFKAGALGGVDQVKEYEIEIEKSKIKLNPQPILLLNGPIPNTFLDNYIRLNDQNFLLYPNTYTNQIIPVADFEASSRSAGYVKSSDVNFVVKNRDEILTLDINQFRNNSTVWVTFDKQSWTVLRYKLSNVIISSVIKEGQTAVIETVSPHAIAVDDIIGIINVQNLTGFYKVKSVSDYTIVIVYTSPSDLNIEDSTFIPIGVFETARFADTAELDQIKYAKLPSGSKIWVDNGDTGGWEVLEKTQQFSVIGVDEYGAGVPIKLGTATVYSVLTDQIISSMPESSLVSVFVKSPTGLSPTQLLFPPTGYENAFNEKFGEKLSVSPDGRWLIVGVPRASSVPTDYRGLYNPTTATYVTNSVVLSNGKLWRAKQTILPGLGGFIDSTNTKWEEVKLNIGNGVGRAVTPANSGAILVYENSQNFGNYKGVWDPAVVYYENDVVRRNAYYYKLIDPTNSLTTAVSLNQDPPANPNIWQTVGAVNQWFLKNVIISPKPAANELYGSSISVSGDGSRYWMAVSALGSNNGFSRVYLYRYENEQWVQQEDARFKGPYESLQSYVVNDIVWYRDKFYKATVNMSPAAFNSNNWSVLTSYSDTGYLPTNAATPDNVDTAIGGFLSGDKVETVDAFDKFGFSTAVSASGEYLAIGAPDNDGSYWPTYKGVWTPYQLYSNGDIVLYATDSKYYQATKPSVIVTDPLNPGTENPLDQHNIGAPNGSWTRINTNTTQNLGRVFVYKKDANSVYKLTQDLNYQTLLTVNETDVPIDTVIENNDQFGYSVAMTPDGNKLFVAGIDSDVDNQNKGRVFIFEKNTQNIYKLKQTIFSPSDVYNEKFGSSLSVSPSGKTLVVSASSGKPKTEVGFDNGTTTFDLTATNFYTSNLNNSIIEVTGTVWVYDLIGGQYVLGEELKIDNITNKEAFGSSIFCSDTVIAVGSPEYRNNALPTGRLFRFERNENATSWFPIEKQNKLTDINLLRSLFIYDPIEEKKLLDIDIVDPFKLKIVGIAEQEIKFKTPYDPARYRFSTNTDVTQEESIAWLDNHVGEVWWNISTAKWPWYEQGSDAYRVGNWGKLAYGSTVDVYEWVESEYRPSEWNELSGTADGLAQNITGTPLAPDDSYFSFKEILDSITGTVSKRYYYYWVKNKLSAPENISSRNLPVAEIAALIVAPELTGTPLIAFTGSSSIVAYNLQPIIPRNTGVLSIQFDKKSSKINLEHREYQLLTENVADSLPSTQLENKWIDSLIGFDQQGNPVPDPNLPVKKRYGINFRPRQSMFVNRQQALKIVINRINNILNTRAFADIISLENLSLKDPIPTLSNKLYDLVVDNTVDLTTVGTAKIKPLVLRANIINGVIDSIDVVDPGFGYKYPPKIEIKGNGINATAEVDPLLIDPDTGRLTDSRGRVTSVVVTNKGRKYTTATVVARGFSVLVKSDTQADGLWTIYTYDEKSKQYFRSKTQAYDTSRYWSYKDWWLDGYSSKSRITETIPALYAEPEININVGELVKVSDYGIGGWAVLERTETSNADILGKYKLVGKQSGTIQLSSALYDSEINKSGYDTGAYYDNVLYDQQPIIEIRNILKAVKEDIFNEDLAIEWNRSFFATVHYLMSEQLYVDWAFKTSFLNATHNVGPLIKKPTYQSDNLDSYKDYINEVKPYRTKVREFLSSYQSLENTSTATTDFDLPSVYNSETNKIDVVNIGSSSLTEYPWKYWSDNYTFSVTEIKIVNAGKDYITAPQVILTGSGQGAKAQAYVKSGKVTAIVVTDPGQGYLTAPTVTLVGGNGNSVENVAKAIAYIGNGKIRSIKLGVKFDRYTKNGRYAELKVTEPFTGTGSQTTFELKYPPSSDRDKIVVSINGERILKSDYSAVTYTSLTNKLTVLKGRIIFKNAPSVNSVISIEYEKNIDVLDSINRIYNFYTPDAGMLGKDPAQLMTGIDFGGVSVQGTTFDVSGGWDALPWFTEGWDTTIPIFSDYYYVVTSDPITGIEREINQPNAPLAGQLITVYLKERLTQAYNNVDGNTVEFALPKSVDLPTVSVDGVLQNLGMNPAVDDYFIIDNLVVFYTAPALGSDVLIETYAAPVRIDGAGRQMPTFVGDGSTKLIEIPTPVQLADKDILIFRPIESDGAVAIVDKNLLDSNISGGTLNAMSGAYTTAKGSTPEEIIIEGSEFVNADQVPAPEENIPGQVLDNLSIKVFQTSFNGSPFMITKTYVSNGTALTYPIGQSVIAPNSVFVLVDKEAKTYLTDYRINFINKEIVFNSAIAVNKIIEIKSVGLSGSGILDSQEFVGDGITRFFLTKAVYEQTGAVFATVDGIETQVSFSNSKDSINKSENTFVEFGTPPADGSMVKITCLTANSKLVNLNIQEYTLNGVTRTFTINGFVPSVGPNDINVIAEIDGKLLTSADVTYEIYNGSNNVLTLGTDPLKSLGDISRENVKVFVNDQQIEYIQEWLFDPLTNLVTINESNLSVGDRILIEVFNDNEYTLQSNNIVIKNNVDISTAQKLTVKWFENYEQIRLVRDIFTGGKDSFVLSSKPLTSGFVWVYKNGYPLTQDYEFSVDIDRAVVKLKDLTTSNDSIQILVYGDQVSTPPTTFEIFKDVLNRYQFKRGPITDLVLSKELNYFDKEIFVTNGTILPEPTRTNIGIILINNERIGYGLKEGNVLKQLTRGLFGTAIPEVHKNRSEVIDVGQNESIPYSDIQQRYDFYGNGINKEFELPFVPRKTIIPEWYRKTTTVNGVVTYPSIPSSFYQCDEIEVFVGGRRLIKSPMSVYSELKGQTSPEADTIIEADFSVNGLNYGTNENPVGYVRLTIAPPAGSRITIIRKQGQIWYPPGSLDSLTYSQSPVANFINQKSTRLPNFNKSLEIYDTLNTESGTTIDDENGNPIEV